MVHLPLCGQLSGEHKGYREQRGDSRTKGRTAAFAALAMEKWSISNSTNCVVPLCLLNGEIRIGILNWCQ